MRKNLSKHLSFYPLSPDSALCSVKSILESLASACLTVSPMMQSRNILPQDGKIMESIITGAGVLDYEPKVIKQMLELSYR